MTWQQLLDRLEAEAGALLAFAANPSSGELPEPPALEALGPLPLHLASRAAAVQASLDAAGAAIAAARDRVALDLVAVGHHEPEAQAARYIDTSA